MPDFLSEASFADLQLPSDRLGHARVASNTLRWVVNMPPGSVIAVQGSWGRGKTDVLARMMQLTRRDPPLPGLPEPAFWLNPWQYATPDLLTPLVQAMLARAETREGVDVAKLKAVTGQLIQAGTSFGLKAAGSVLPGGELLKLAAPEAARLLASLTGPEAPAPGGDPVARMAANFRTLADALLPPEIAGVGGRIVVLVDDLDRCLPDRQVALLQALRFLISAGAPVSVVVALDPILARQGVLAAYRSDAFDPDLYLDKMFDLRVNLGPIDGDALNAQIAGLLERTVVVSNQERPLGSLLARGWASLPIAAPSALGVQSLRNPRVVRRVFDKLKLLVVSGRLPNPEDPAVAKLMLQFLAISERWPQVRSALFEKGIHVGLDRLAKHYTGQQPSAGLPDDADLERLFTDIAQRRDSAAVVYPRMQEVLVGAGF